VARSTPFSGPTGSRAFATLRGLRRQIESGELEPGKQLHSETVGAIFDVSKRTAARALQILATTGHVVIVRSRGTYVGPTGLKVAATLCYKVQ